MQGRTARILAIGDHLHFTSAYPNSTTLLWTGWRPCEAYGPSVLDCTPERFVRAIRDVRAGRYDLVVAFLPHRRTAHPRYWLRSWAHTPLQPYAATMRVFGVAWLRMASVPVPMAAIDVNDDFGLGRHNFFMLDKADVVFKRELPADRWHLLSRSAHPALPTLRLRRAPSWQRRLEKIRPFGLPADVLNTHGLFEEEFPSKSTDIFFSGNVDDNSWVRREGLKEMRELAARGYKVDVPAQRLSHDEFLRRMSRAWLAWSPSGFGWECYRTSEAAQCLTVPLVNHPTVERHRPLLHGVHLFQYDIEPGGLVRAAEVALADKARLRQMAQAAREHVLANHTVAALADHVVATTLAAKKTA
jgi:hypothetical protein